MKRWPSGLNEDVRAIRRQNKERIISLLIQKIENRHAPSSRYLFLKEARKRTNAGWSANGGTKPVSSGNGRKKPYRTEPDARQLPVRRNLAALSQSTQERNACLHHPLLFVIIESYRKRI